MEPAIFATQDFAQKTPVENIYKSYDYPISQNQNSSSYGK